MLSIQEDRQWMQRTLVLAQQALPVDVPVGAIVVDSQGKLVSEAYNQRELLQKPSAHAEVLALDEAAKSLKNWRLNGCTLYVTLEPCSMCSGLIVQSRISRVVFGAYDPKDGFVSSKSALSLESLQVYGGILEDECSELLKGFFQARRNQ
ncbi:MAG: nucleoside deaminase [Candidatus Caenarcaniphilales bacterium]|nr:nucleoside deaminase [Candidatus Caenarcaniphilales bacterium]